MRSVFLATTAALSLASLSVLAEGPATSAGVKSDQSAQSAQSGQQAAADQHKIQSPDQLSWQPAPPSLPPGAELAVLQGDPAGTDSFVARLRVPAGYYVAPHSHPTDENLTLISGSMLYGSGDQADKAKAAEFPAGSYVFLPAKHTHYVWSGDQGFVMEIQAKGPFDLTYVNPDDDPRKEMAKATK